MAFLQNIVGERSHSGDHSIAVLTSTAPHRPLLVAHLQGADGFDLDHCGTFFTWDPDDSYRAGSVELGKSGPISSPSSMPADSLRGNRLSGKSPLPLTDTVSLLPRASETKEIFTPTQPPQVALCHIFSQSIEKRNQYT